jgi:hypothetical protein
MLTALLLTQHAAASPVDSLEALDNAIRGLAAGVTIEVADGAYKTPGPIRIEGRHGTEAKPITIRAEHRGGAAFGGKAGFVLKDCEHLVLEGFVFENDANQQAVLLENCRNVRVTRNVFQLDEQAKPRWSQHWVYLVGNRSGDNRVDHNLFGRKANGGSPVFVRGDDTTLTPSQHDRVDHNYFRDVIYADDSNGHETIRTGSNDMGASGLSTFTIIEHNLLERCSGEQEIVSLKSSDNIVRHNTFVNCRGSISLRLGNRNEVSGNFMLNPNGDPGCGGVKIYGFDHRVFNNYFLGLTGAGHEAPLALIPGVMDTPTTDQIGKKYQDLTTVPATRAWIAFNTWIDCESLLFGATGEDKRRIHAPRECAFINNLVVRAKPKKSPLVKQGLIHDLRTAGNLGFSGGATPSDPWATWFRWEDPRLRRSEHDRGLWLLTDSSPAIDSAVESSVTIDDDVFGRARSGPRDAGAEELNNEAIVRRPLTSEYVGPAAR